MFQLVVCMWIIIFFILSLWFVLRPNRNASKKKKNPKIGYCQKVFVSFHASGTASGSSFCQCQALTELVWPSDFLIKFPQAGPWRVNSLFSVLLHIQPCSVTILNTHLNLFKATLHWWWLENQKRCVFPIMCTQKKSLVVYALLAVAKAHEHKMWALITHTVTGYLIP